MSEGPATTDSYSQWKGWVTDGSFGRLARGDADYFTRELREAVGTHRTVADVLEVGFGDGVFLSYARDRGWKVVGTELSEVQVAAAREAGFDAHGPDHVATMPTESIDLIVAFDVLEHIPQDAIIEFLQSLTDRLRPGGRILLRYPNADSWLSNPLQHGDPTHVTQIGYYKMTYFAESAGLRIVRYRGPRRRGFASSIVHGVHRLVATPIIAVAAAVTKGLYFPGEPFVFSSHNAVCVLGRADDA